MARGKLCDFVNYTPENWEPKMETIYLECIRLLVARLVGRKKFFFQSTIHAHYSTKVAPAGDSSSSPLFDDHHRVPNYHLPFDPWI